MIKNRLVALLLTGALTMGSAGTALADNGRGKGHAPGQAKKFTENFKDWDQNFWGNESLSRLILMGIMQGDGAGQIQSNKPVTRLEAAITVIRLLGLQKTNQPVNLDKEDQEQTPEWGMEAVLIGLQHGFLEGGKGKLQPNKPLTRLEAAVLLVKAAGLKAEAEAEVGASLPFKDTQKLSGAAKGYLAIAIEKGFIRGMEDNTFKPEKPLTRAEWATMLDRLDRNEGPAVRPDGKQIKGEVLAVKTVDGLAALEVKTPVYPGGVTYKFDDAALLYKDLKEISLDDVAAGDHVILQLSEDRTILMVTVYTPAATVSQSAGTVTAWTKPTANQPGSITFKPSSGEAKSLPVAVNATVKLNGETGALDDVLIGDQVQLTVTNGAVTAISIKVIKQDLTGTLKAVTAGTTAQAPTITIESGNPATSRTFAVVDWAELRKDGSTTPITMNDLKAGQQVKVSVERNVATKIVVLADSTTPTPGQTAAGTVLTWAAPTATAEGNIVLNTTGSEMKLFPVAKGAKVTLGENEVTAADVKVGDSVTLTLTDGKVTAIKLQATATSMTGTLTAIATPTGGGRAQLSIKSGETTKSLAIAPWATFKLTGSTEALALADLVVGSTVKVTILHDLVTAVEVTALPVTTEEITGAVMAWIAPTATQAGSVAILADGEMVLIPVAKNASVKLNGQPILFADVLVGDEVTLTVTDNTVTAIEIEAAVTTSTGTLKAVTAATSSARATLTIESGATDATRTLAVASWATFELEGSTEAITLADLEIDSTVVLRIAHGLIVEVTVIELPADQNEADSATGADE